MSAINATTYPTIKSKLEKLWLLMLHWRCYLSTYENLNDDPHIQEFTAFMLRKLILHVPSGLFCENYIRRCGTFGSRGQWALKIDDDMTTVTVIRTSSLANVLQFVRGAA